MKSRVKQFFVPITILSAASLVPGYSIMAQFPEFPPATVTSMQDRDQMMEQLGISFPELLPKTADDLRPANTWPSDPANQEGNWTDSLGHVITRSGFGLWNNYNENKAWNYTPIDLLRMKDGTPVISAGQWWENRRPEIMRDASEQLWGVIPPDSVLPSVIFSSYGVDGGNETAPYTEKIITGTIDISRYPRVRNVPEIRAILRIPSNAAKPVPVMIVIGNPFWTPMDNYWELCGSNGWGVCIFDCMMLQPDNGAGLTSYLIGLCNKGNWRKPTDWGTLAAWSWGVSKLIDFFETDSTIDAGEIGVTGHSRFGKAALVAMAYESRLAIAFPSCAGSLGSKMNRRHWGQDLENSAWDREYHWVAGNFFRWMGPLCNTAYLPRKIEDCPVDAHSLLSLCAPRPVFLNAGTQDSWTDPYGICLAGIGASPVYRLLGKQGLIMADEEPKADVAYTDGTIAFRMHTGGHTDGPDWPAFFKFASKIRF
jgi:hypothetical protein